MMPLPLNDEYRRTVDRARAAIREIRNRPRVSAIQDPMVLVARLRAKLADGEQVSLIEIEALDAALCDQHQASNRGRGRPKGSLDFDARRATLAACLATEKSLLRTYRNGPTRPHLTRCDAIAEAMREERFRTLITYDAVAQRMRELRRELRDLDKKMQAAAASLPPEIKRGLDRFDTLHSALAKGSP